MADTAVQIGYGATVKLGNGASPSVLTLLGEVTSISLPNPQTDTHEATNFSSPNRAREYIAGLTDYGEITIGMNFVAGSATDTLLTEARAAYARRDVEITIPTSADADGWTYSFEAIVTGYSKEVPLDDRQAASVTLRITGPVTEASAGA